MSESLEQLALFPKEERVHFQLEDFQSHLDLTARVEREAFGLSQTYCNFFVYRSQVYLL